MVRAGDVLRQALRSVPCWALAIVAAILAARLDVPLAWVLGPLVVAGAFSIAERAPYSPVQARRLGQVVVGTAIGLNLTTDAASKLALWLPAMVLTAVLSLILAAMLSILLARWGRVDRCTAYFALLPGGLSEMANVGNRLGAMSEAISLSHALRVALSVLIIPPVVLMIDMQELLGGQVKSPVLGWDIVLALGLASLAGAMVMRLMRIANPWMLGALAASGLLSGSGLVAGRIPQELMWLGQLLIGLAIGARFKGRVIRRLPRFALVSSVATIGLGLLMAGYGGLLRLTGWSDYESLLLAVSPGGFAEMTLVAQQLHLDVALVTGFHFVRAFAVNSLALPLWTHLEKYAWFAPPGPPEP